MFFAQRLSAPGVALFLSLTLLAGPSYAGDVSVRSKAQGLAHYIMAVCHDLNGEDAQAVSEYKKSVKFNGLEPAPRVKLGAYYLRLGRLGAATLQLKAVTRIAPEYTAAHYLLALIYSSEHKFDLAASEYEVILKNAAHDSPSTTDAYMQLGQLYYARQEYPQAIEQFSKVIAIAPANTSALNFLGSVLADSRQNAKAIGIFREVLRMDPANSEALNSLGYMYAQEGVHLDEAVRMVRQAIEIDPANGAYYDSLGWALYKKGMYRESLMALQKAGMYIEDEVLYDHLGDVYQALKEYAMACQYWRKSLDLDRHQVLVRQKIKQLEKCIVSQSTHRLN